MDIHSVNLEWYNTKYKQVYKQIIDLSKRQWINVQTPSVYLQWYSNNTADSIKLLLAILICLLIYLNHVFPRV